MLVLIAGAAGCGVAPEIDDVEQAATAPYKAVVRRGQLSVTGNGSSTRLALRLGATGLLEVDVGDDGVADFRFDRSTFDRIVIDAGGGDDVVRIDESGGVFTTEEQVTISGGDGNDTLLGGSGAETFYGGPGNDTIDGGPGSDVIHMGDGDDTYVWYPGRNSDVVDGEAGKDVMVFNGAAIGEQIDLSADGDRLRFTRDIALVTMDLGGVERVEVHALGGGDSIAVHDLAGTPVARVDVDLAGVLGGAAGDGQPDVVTVEGTAGADTVDVAADGAAVVASGLTATVAVTHGEPSLDRLVVAGAADDLLAVNGSDGPDSMLVVDDGGRAAVQAGGFGVTVVAAGTQLAVNGLGGDDSIRAISIATPLVLDGGDGNDTIAGGAGADLILGGAGDDVLDGGYGSDTVLMGTGDDVFVWNPGSGSDHVEGEDGADRMVFNASNANDGMDLSANGSRLRFARDIGSVNLDVDGVEQVEVHALGGADSVTVHDLAATQVARVDIDLAAIAGSGTGDGLADVVTLDRSPGADTIDVSAAGAAVIATGLGAQVSVTGGEPGLDRLLVNGAGGDAVNVNGSAAADDMTVFDDGGRPAVLVAGACVTVAATGMAGFAVHGLGGDDTIRAVSIAIPLVLDGGDGNDSISGGAGADLIIGGAGDDVLDGGLGNDTVYMGAGDDRFVWNPGAASDRVEGEDGADALVFNGSAASETMALSASGGRTQLLRDVGAVALDIDGVERIDVRALGGTDRMTVNDLAGTAVGAVNVDLAAPTGGGDAALDVVTVNGSPAADTIAVTADAGAVLVSGLAAPVRITRPEVSDQLVVNGLGGVDAISVGPGVDTLMSLAVNQ